MADVKISGLPASTLPLAGTEVLPIVQSGVTKKVATDDLTVKNLRSNSNTGLLQIAGPAAAATRVMTTPDANFTVARIDAAQSFTGDQTLSTGNLVIGTSGKGIDFSAANNAAGMTNELLADYEEGVFNAGIAFGGNSVDTTYAVREFAYQKVGSIVNITGLLALNNKGTSTGAATITGLPFVATSGYKGFSTSSFHLSGVTFSGYPNCYIGGDSSVINLLECTEAGTGNNLTNSNVTNSANIVISLTYRAA